MERYYFIKTNLPNKPTQREIHIPTSLIPFRSHRVTHLADDFYTNLVSWSKNIVVYACDDKVFSLNFNTNQVIDIASMAGRSITCLGFDDNGDKLAVACTNGSVDIVDMCSLKANTIQPHKSRIGAMQWSGNELFTGSRDRTVKKIDVRTGVTSIFLSGHTQEVCGLRLNSTRRLLCTGGNDNHVIVIDSRAICVPLFNLKNHTAAVKGIAWSQSHPYSLLTGGGTADKTIKMWDISGDAKIVKEIDTCSQVCNLHWCKDNRIISTHGYSQNDSRIYNMRLVQQHTNRGHKNRIIHFALSTDEQFYLTGSSDNILNMWKIGDKSFKLGIK